MTINCLNTGMWLHWSNRGGFPFHQTHLCGLSKSYILSSIDNNTINSFAFHLSCGGKKKLVNDTHMERKKKINAALHPSQGGPNINRDLWSRGKLPLLALLHTLPEGIERCIRWQTPIFIQAGSVSLCWQMNKPSNASHMLNSLVSMSSCYRMSKTKVYSIYIYSHARDMAQSLTAHFWWKSWVGRTELIQNLSKGLLLNLPQIFKVHKGYILYFMFILISKC